jgi:hypothetical protein
MVLDTINLFTVHHNRDSNRNNCKFLQNSYKLSHVMYICNSMYEKLVCVFTDFEAVQACSTDVENKGWMERR